MINIVNKINKLTKKEKVHILNILKEHKIDYTKNSHGYYFNLYNISEDIIKKLKTAKNSQASSCSPQGRRMASSLGVAGAPKFFLNWLTFAHSTYDPDHKIGPGEHLGRALSSVYDFSTARM